MNKKRKPAPDDRDELSFRIASMLCGFDLAAFDVWFAALRPCAARDELLELRRKARAAFLTTGTESAKPFLELMHVRRIFIQRDEFLLPLARKGEPFNRGKPKGAAGPLRKLVRTMLARKGNRKLTARELWEACTALPARQRIDIEFGSADAWIPEHGNVSFRRFANIVSEEKNLLP